MYKQEMSLLEGIINMMEGEIGCFDSCGYGSTCRTSMISEQGLSLLLRPLSLRYYHCGIRTSLHRGRMRQIRVGNI